MPRDVGRMGESDRLEDAYRFRTPSLRNWRSRRPPDKTAPTPTLEGIVRHHDDPLGVLERRRRADADLPDAAWLAPIDFVIGADAREAARHRAILDIEPVR